MSYDKVAWRNQKEAARVVEEARKSGDPERVETALVDFWRVVDANPLYPEEKELDK